MSVVTTAEITEIPVDFKTRTGDARFSYKDSRSLDIKIAFDVTILRCHEKFGRIAGVSVSVGRVVHVGTSGIGK